MVWRSIVTNARTATGVAAQSSAEIPGGICSTLMLQLCNSLGALTIVNNRHGRVEWEITWTVTMPLEESEAIGACSKTVMVAIVSIGNR
jgi:hypothetical protein